MGYTRQFLIALMALSTLPGSAAADVDDEIAYDASAAAFSDDGPSSTDVDDRIRVSVSDDDPRRIWTLSVNYERPVAERVRASLGVIGRVLGVSEQLGQIVSGGGRTELEESAVQVANSANEMALVLRAFVGAAAVTEADVTRVKDKSSSLRDLLAALGDKLAASGAETLPDDQRQPLEEAYRKGARVLGMAVRVIRVTEEAEQSRQRVFRVRGGNERVVVRVCARRLVVGGDDYLEIELSEPECTESSYTMTVRDPLGSISLAAGIVVPIVRKSSRFSVNDAGDLEEGTIRGGVRSPEPAVFVGARHVFPGSLRPHVGLDVGVLVGERLGEGFTIGGFVGAGGISIGGGLFLDTEGDRRAIDGITSGSIDDRTESVPLGGGYVRIALSSDLWELLGGALPETGATNEEEPAPATPEPVPELQPAAADAAQQGNPAVGTPQLPGDGAVVEGP